MRPFISRLGLTALIVTTSSLWPYEAQCRRVETEINPAAVNRRGPVPTLINPVNCPVIDDATVNSYPPPNGSGDGSGWYLSVGTWWNVNIPYPRSAVVKVDLSPLAGQYAQRAVLNLFPALHQGDPRVCLFSVAPSSCDWSEQAISWSNEYPCLMNWETTSIAPLQSGPGDWWKYDVTCAVNNAMAEGQTEVSFKLVSVWEPPPGTCPIGSDQARIDEPAVWDFYSKDGPQSQPYMEVTAAATASASWQEEVVDPQSLSAVSAVNSDVVWVGGAMGRVLLTEDGGVTWQVRSVPTNLQVYCMWAFNEQVCVAAACSPTQWPGPSQVWRTETGGVSWTQTATVANYTDGLHFFDDSHGWLLADPSGGVFTILLTSDGGRSWHSGPSAPPGGPNDWAWMGSFTWVGSSVCLFGTSEYNLWRTSNGGSSWQAVPVELGDVYSVAVNANGIGYAGGGYYTPPTGNMIRSTDYGATWTSTEGPNSGAPIQCLRWIPGSNHLWAATQSCGVANTLRSTNEGVDWVVQPLGTRMSYVQRVDFADVNTGWAAGYDFGDGLGRVWKFDGGGSQQNPAWPDSGGSDEWVFVEAESGRWFDPPLVSGYRYRMTSGSLFQSILDFPAGFDGPFAVSVGGIPLGQFVPGETADLGGVTEFEVTGIQPAVAPEDPAAFPLKLAFNTSRADFVMIPLEPAGVQAGPGGSGASLRPAPNPSVGKVAIHFTRRTSGTVTLTLFDNAGRCVRSMSQLIPEAGAHHCSWDGTDGNGVAVPTGVYYYIITGGGERQSGKITLVR
jgi:photosystem II stability/assembly factor-like uncharacterized protein